MVRSASFSRIVLACFAVFAAVSAQAEPGAKFFPRRAVHTAEPEPANTPPGRFFSIREVLAKVDAAKTTQGSEERPDWPLRLVSLGSPERPAADAAPVQSADEPFGFLTFRAPEGVLWRKWRKMESGLSDEAELIDACLANESTCTPAARRFVKIVAEVKAKSGRSRIAEANRDINAVVRYMTDYAQFGELDRWTTPLETLTSGLGDCEDYAIAKYAVLRYAGVAEADLRLVLVHDRSIRADHAVLAVRDGGKWLILDNRHSYLNEDGEQRQLTPLFALDQDGVKLFAAPYVSRPEIEKATVPAPSPAASIDTTGWELRGTTAAGEPASNAVSSRPLLL